jgi:serine/threonine-protein kinase
MALELLEGVDLQGALESGVPPDPKVTLPVVLQVLTGLGHAHEHGIVHRDVKPSNVFLPLGRPAKIMDFGVARLAGGMTTTGIVVGTPSYMSPEQVRAGPIDGRSDLFSAGLILYELVTGKKAYRADSVVALLYKIAHEEPDISLIPSSPEWGRLREVLQRALARDPAQRYPDATAMASDLSLALQDLGGYGDWATASDLGATARTLAHPKDVTLGTGSPPIVAAMELGTLSLREPEAALTHPARPAKKRTRIPALAGALVVASLIALAFVGRGVVPRPASGPSAPPITEALQPSVEEPAQDARPLPTSTPTAPAPARSVLPVAEKPAAAPSVAPSPLPQRPSVDRANDELEQRHYLQALTEARAVLRRDPDSAEARTIADDAEAALVIEEAIHKANLALQKGDKDTAVSEINKGLAVNNNDARLLKLLRQATQ